MIPSGASVYLPAIVLALGLLLAAVAWRGRRVDDHPLCRRCGFDLFGAPPDSRLCSECGTDLSRRRAVRIGHRQARRRLMAVALPPVLLSAGWLGVLGYGAARGTEWNRHKPAWWLVSDLAGGDQPTRTAAYTELAARAADGRLAGDGLNSAIGSLLDRQADPGRRWDPICGQLVEHLHDNDRLGDDAWRRYRSQLVRLELELKRDVAAGGPVPVRVRAVGRAGTDGRFVVNCTLPPRVEIAGRAFGTEGFVSHNLRIGGTPVARDAVLVPDGSTASAGPLPPGRYPVSVGPVACVLWSDRDQSVEWHRYKAVLAGELTVVADGPGVDPAVRAQAAGRAAEAVRASLSPEVQLLGVPRTGPTPAGGRLHISITCRGGRWRRSVAHTVHLRGTGGDPDVPIGALVGDGAEVDPHIARFEADITGDHRFRPTVDVVLKPDHRLAARTFVVTDLADQPIVFTVPLARPPRP